MDWEALRLDPLVLKFARRSMKNLGQEYGAPQVNTPQQVVGEQRLIAGLIHHQEIEARGQGTEGRSMAEDLIRAVPFLWLNDIDPFVEAFALPRHVIGSDMMPHDRCWWTFQGGHPIVNTETGQRLGLADGVLIVRTGGVFDVGVIGQKWPLSTMAQAGLMVSVRFKAGQRWPDEIPPKIRPTVGLVLSRLAFLSAPFVESIIQRPHPKVHGRRRVQMSPEGVRFVRLRPTVPEEDSRIGHPVGVAEWHHRWLVRGHLRAQWYPKAKEHRLIWISPYAKGPADKPFKTPIYVVVR